MKNIILFLGITGLALQDYFKKQPVKATRQQQFLQTGETAQYFIGAVEDEVVSLLKNLFTVKKIPKSHWIYKQPSYENVEIFEINGGVKNANMTLLIEEDISNSVMYYTVYLPNGYEQLNTYYKISYRLFKNNGVTAHSGYKEDILYYIWNSYIIEYNVPYIYDKVENFKQIEKLAETDTELAFILLSGVPNIKKILR